ncbi:P-loop containing nucleoside triphosphate hydrolase protein [Lentinula edodes]|uniref:P-loop containing nucleoside triphosphate hydrolase protein n=1 Tax=Lentinula edodes TaxID=5353 RepID=UPI001E8CED56|nr:P-loop containing nucleoside triphosphate hydrolase protein [Lentinula edodes]KAH7868508.1 P-loop containing nucleoside triphosphate hydrolase protein [Lentinula edodes]KAJ3898625.1 P-loop containing nucleoside triphosphate hydrolase protein [Lentinula edodes]
MYIDAKARQLALVLVELLANTGIPASGKSTFADLLYKYTDSILQNDPRNSVRAILVLLDGWHLTRAQLDQFPDPKLARDRRGSHWNFDGPNLREEVLPETERIITAPSFDHAIKDPTSHAVQIHPQHRIVIIEGLYTALDVDSWREAALLLDERWYLELDFEEAQKRLVNRNLVSGVAKDPAEAVWRAEANGMPNGRFLLTNTVEATRVITSVEDPVLALPA